MPPSLSATDPGLTIEKDSVERALPGAPFLVSSIHIVGNTQFETATLRALLVDAEGKRLTIAQLSECVDRITDYYRRHDYPLAKAIIPAQTIRDGTVTIQVVEARYGSIEFNNRSRVNNPRLESMVSLQLGALIEEKQLNHDLLLLSDTPGISVYATLSPGDTVGTSDLRLDATSGAAVGGDFSMDGYGDAYTGRQRIGATLEVINPLHQGDVLTVNGLTTGSRNNYGRVAYESLLNGHGTRMGASYSALRYIFGGSLDPLDAHGSAQVHGIWAKQTLMRSQDVNLYGQVQYNHLELRDRIDAADIRTDRHLGSWATRLSGDERDGFLAGGANGWSVSWTTGQVDFANATAQSVDAVTAKTQGGYSRFNATFVRQQRLSQNGSLYVSVAGQWADANLDPSEKMIAGGPYSVRAYDIGAVSGDTGYLGTAEYRYEMGSKWGGQWRAIAFVDRAQLAINKLVWSPADNHVALNGAGLGISQVGMGRWTASAHVAAPIGATPGAEGISKSVRAWLEVGTKF
jgi:hemolysin activation/secretion protein